FCPVKETIDSMQRQHNNWEWMFAKHTLGEGEKPKDTINSHVSTRKKNKPMKTWANDGHRDFSQEDLKRANR
ncbi:hypothetical protein C0133_08870, partial [Moraxella catarrhalis]|nr:hypothetical protein [Moraxella catarrhalis]